VSIALTNMPSVFMHGEVVGQSHKTMKPNWERFGRAMNSSLAVSGAQRTGWTTTRHELANRSVPEGARQFFQLVFQSGREV
jgi:hypothetical protein